MAKRGRPRSNPDKLPAKLPKKENERHRQMRAYFLSLPEPQRTYQAVMDKFGVAFDTVYHAALAFKWIEDAEKRDGAIIDPFLEKHGPIIDEFRINALFVACKHLENEMLRTGIKDATLPKSVQKKMDIGDIDGAGADLTNFIKFLPMKAKDYKDLSSLIDLVRKIVFEWDPNKMNHKQPVSMPITGGKNFIMVNNPYAPKPTEASKN